MPQDLETTLDNILLNHNKERKIINEPGDSDWGQLIIPGKHENPSKTNQGLKIVIMAGYRTGLLLIKTLIEIEKKHPDKLNIVGLITDDPLSPHARISMKRRIWRLFDDNQKLTIEDAVIETALSYGITCYTGAVKTTYARKLIHHWNPDVIEVLFFGQIIDEPIIKQPEYGIYNFHPADLAHHHGAGPQPFQDLINRDAHTSKFTIHQLTTQLDLGGVVGQSPKINVRNEDGTIPNNILILEDKMIEPMDTMAVVLTHKLIKLKENNSQTIINQIDFSNYFTKEQKKLLMKPIVETEPVKGLPAISTFALKLMESL